MSQAQDHYHTYIMSPEQFQRRGFILPHQYEQTLAQAKAQGTNLQAVILEASFGNYLMDLSQTTEGART